MKNIINKILITHQGEELTIKEKRKMNNKNIYIATQENNNFDEILSGKYIKKLLKDQNKIKNSLKKQEKTNQELKEKEIAAKKEYEDIDGFAANKSKMQRGRILKILNREQKYSGKYYNSRKEFIREKVKEGYIVTKKDGKRIFKSPDGSWFEDLTKTELDYAEYLIS